MNGVKPVRPSGPIRPLTPATPDRGPGQRKKEPRSPPDRDGDDDERQPIIDEYV